MIERGRAEPRAYENLAYIRVATDDGELLLDLLAETSDSDLAFLAGCSLEEFLKFVRR